MVRRLVGQLDASSNGLMKRAARDGMIVGRRTMPWFVGVAACVLIAGRHSFALSLP
jgi:hypothetical protein